MVYTAIVTVKLFISIKHQYLYVCLHIYSGYYKPSMSFEASGDSLPATHITSCSHVEWLIHWTHLYSRWNMYTYILICVHFSGLHILAHSLDVCGSDYLSENNRNGAFSGALFVSTVTFLLTWWPPEPRRSSLNNSWWSFYLLSLCVSVCVWVWGVHLCGIEPHTTETMYFISSIHPTGILRFPIGSHKHRKVSGSKTGAMVAHTYNGVYNQFRQGGMCMTTTTDWIALSGTGMVCFEGVEVIWYMEWQEKRGVIRQPLVRNWRV